MKIISKILVLMFVVFFVANINAQNINKITLIKIKLSVQCEMCKTKIVKNITNESGVKNVSVDLIAKQVTIEYIPEKTNPEKLRLAISKLGFDADDIAAEAKAYNRLPKQCKKP